MGEAPGRWENALVAAWGQDLPDCERDTDASIGVVASRIVIG